MVFVMGSVKYWKIQIGVPVILVFRVEEILRKTWSILIIQRKMQQAIKLVLRMLIFGNYLKKKKILMQ
jgi:hypothetical protein